MFASLNIKPYFEHSGMSRDEIEITFWPKGRKAAVNIAKTMIEKMGYEDAKWELFIIKNRQQNITYGEKLWEENN